MKHTKHILLMAAMLLCGLSASGEVIQIDGVWYDIVKKTGQAEVVADPNGTKYKSNITIPSTVISEDVECNVTSIGSNAFYGCRNLTSITIPVGVTSIGNYAFHNCSSLTSITIPVGVTSIGHHALSGCSSLTSITIPESVTSIGGMAFSNCTGLTAIIIPDGVNKIEELTFYSCSNLTSITLSENLTSIGSKAFRSCRSLASITIPESVVAISDLAFDGCTSLTSITIPKGITRIGAGTFANCRSLLSIVIPESMISIGEQAFVGCCSLASIVVEKGNTVYDSREDCNAIIKTSSNTLIAGCFSTIIPENVVSIENFAFSSCIGLTSITIPESVISIGNYAFANCSSLTSITIPKNVVSIGENAFILCSVLESIKVLAVEPPFAHDNTFDNYDIELYVPEKVLATYQGITPWDNFASIKTFNDENAGIATTPPLYVLVLIKGGVITLTGLAEGTKVAVYDIAGVEVGAAVPTNGTAVISTYLSVGSTAIVKIAGHSVKVIVK